LEQNRENLGTSKAKHEDLTSLLLAPKIDEKHDNDRGRYVEDARFEDYVREKLEHESLREEFQRGY
jgi:hypothetical protein